MASLQFSMQHPGFHMHDCYITDMTLDEQSFIFELAHGMYIFKDKAYVQTGPARLIFSKTVECEVQYLKDNTRECVDAKVLKQDLKNGYIELIYEMYNESAAHFEGILIQGSQWKAVTINIFFQKLEILYEQERVN